MINLHLFFLKLGTSNKDVACILKKVLTEDTTETYALKFIGSFVAWKYLRALLSKSFHSLNK